MKNLMITHNEIQLNLFLAVTYGMQAMYDGEYAINGESKERDYEWKVTRADKEESSALLPPVFYYQIDKGAYEMNDIRIGVTSTYIRDHARKFIAAFRAFIHQKKAEEKDTSGLTFKLTHQVTSNIPSDHAVYITDGEGSVDLAGYGTDYHGALNHLELLLEAPDCPFAIVRK